MALSLYLIYSHVQCSPIFTARRCAGTVYAVIVCPFVDSSIRPSVRHKSEVLRR